MKKNEKELLKKEIRTFYETHFKDIKEVAELYKISERTLYNWVKTESWQKGKLIKNTELKAITKKLLEDKDVLDSLQVTKKALKESMKENSDGLYRIYEERILDNTADELLLKAMGEQFINTQITKTALIAQSEFNRLASLSNQGSPNPKVISCAREVVSIFIDMKKSLYPHTDNTQVNINAILQNNGTLSKEQIAELTDEQIRVYLNEK